MRIKYFLFLFLISLTTYPQERTDFELKARVDSLGSYLIGKNYLPTSVTFKLINKETDQVAKKIIIQSNDSSVVFRYSKTNKQELLDTFNAKYKAQYMFGDSLSSKPDKDYLYKLPFKRNKKYKLIQGWGGNFSHNHEASLHALDFKMKIGQPVHAARGGVVVQSIERYKKNGGREMIAYANAIVIRHKDGTFASYLHLKHKGSLVEVGQLVDEGELIGFSGHTGFSTQPHLHFVVRDGNGRSIPIYFKEYPKRKFRRGRYYQSK